MAFRAHIYISASLNKFVQLTIFIISPSNNFGSNFFPSCWKKKAKICLHSLWPNSIAHWSEMKEFLKKFSHTHRTNHIRRQIVTLGRMTTNHFSNAGTGSKVYCSPIHIMGTRSGTSHHVLARDQSHVSPVLGFHVQ